MRFIVCFGASGCPWAALSAVQSGWFVCVLLAHLWSARGSVRCSLGEYTRTYNSLAFSLYIAAFPALPALTCEVLALIQKHFALSPRQFSYATFLSIPSPSSSLCTSLPSPHSQP
ncbi:hypothetical protein E2C01_060889 [Portunus trituberculatus]|uniref:Uncharacterized protein n=1 Tax=Portunus trituberculatus TaxID=210409 RepID=A0A5B7HBS0_PORTR|nr:hypothetical protein [Portunus trituberculatus]